MTKMRIILTLILLSCTVILAGDNSPVAAENTQKRIRFQITTVGETRNERKILAQTTIEGDPGTDFDIDLQTGGFKMQSRFLSDLVSDDRLKIRARIETRRFYGMSPANLPLYEEDSQKKSFEIGFDEALVLLPHGRNVGAETLKIEIVPTLSEVAGAKTDRPIKISFEKPVENSEISIRARKIPHWFAVEAVLLADGAEIARGTADCLIEEEKEIILQPAGDKAATPFRAKVTVDKFIRNRPQDLIGINFGFYQGAEPILANGAGINLSGKDFVYALNGDLLSKDKNFQLKFNVRAREEK